MSSVTSSSTKSRSSAGWTRDVPETKGWFWVAIRYPRARTYVVKPVDTFWSPREECLMVAGVWASPLPTRECVGFDMWWQPLAMPEPPVYKKSRRKTA